MPQSCLKLAVVAPSGTFDPAKLKLALQKANILDLQLVSQSSAKEGLPTFLNGSKEERLQELILAESIQVDGIWCMRGGCGAIELWQDYQPEAYIKTTAPLIGYSDITILHFLRFYRAARIGIHGPVFMDLIDEDPAHIEAVKLLLNKQAQKLVYPALKNLTPMLTKTIKGELIPMNLASLQSILGCFDSGFLRGKILALEDINEPHYKVFRMLHQLKNAGLLSGLKAILLGYFDQDRQAIIEETAMPLAQKLGIPLFDWPIFGHQKPNWPLLFGASVNINSVDEHFFTLNYNEQHDHTVIDHDF